MVQHPQKGYDIDDGVYFWKDDLKGPQGGDKPAPAVKEMVRRALHDDRFKRPPETRLNCVRVYYNAGYHVDVPVYRKVKIAVPGEERVHVEIASTDWKRTDPVAVTRWFRERNEKSSPDETNGRQLRRQTRLLKAFAASRESWRARTARGFTITTLIANDCYHANYAREDESLYRTMVAIRDRLNSDLEVAHPTVSEEMLTSGPDDGRTKFLRDRLSWAVEELDVLFRQDCTRQAALKAWSSVFDTLFFTGRLKREEASGRGGAGAGGVPALVGPQGRPVVDRRGGGRYA